MSQSYSGGFIVATTTGVTVTTSGASASVSIPVASDGSRPRFLRIAATTESYFKIGVAGVTATNQDILVQPADAVILAIPSGITTLAYIQGTSSGKVNLIALESI